MNSLYSVEPGNNEEVRWKRQHKNWWQGEEMSQVLITVVLKTFSSCLVVHKIYHHPFSLENQWHNQ